MRFKDETLLRKSVCGDMREYRIMKQNNKGFERGARSTAHEVPFTDTARKTYPGMSKGRYASYKRGWEAADKRLTPTRRRRKVVDAS